MRARNLKPTFFKNDILGMMPMAARLLFQGLWCMADREGRLEDRPLRIKVEVLPYDDVDVDALLDQLAAQGFILRYTAGEVRYIQVVNFGKHQNPHIKEAASVIPAPEEHRTSTVQEQVKPDAGTISPPDMYEASPADSPFLNPDSPLLTPEAGDARVRARDTLRDFGIDDQYLDKTLEAFPEFVATVDAVALDFATYHGASPPKSGTRAWLNWLKKQREFEHERASKSNGHHANGRGTGPAHRRGAVDPASQISGDTPAGESYERSRFGRVEVFND